MTATTPASNITPQRADSGCGAVWIRPTLADVLDELRAIRRAVERIAERLDGPG